MPEADPLVLMLGLIGITTSMWTGWKSVRWFVHKMDALERSAMRVDEAAGLIIHEFKVNGGRVVEPIDSSVKAHRATLKDLLLDQRGLLQGIVESIKEQDELAEKRNLRVINELRKK